LIRTLNINWSSANDRSLQTILFGSQIWGGTASSPFQVGDLASGMTETWDPAANLVLEPRTTKPLTLIFKSKITMRLLWISIQIGSDPENICIIKPPPAN
jgi:hypothetical protein